MISQSSLDISLGNNLYFQQYQLNGYFDGSEKLCSGVPRPGNIVIFSFFIRVSLFIHDTVTQIATMAELLRKSFTVLVIVLLKQSFLLSHH